MKKYVNVSYVLVVGSFLVVSLAVILLLRVLNVINDANAASAAINSTLVLSIALVAGLILGALGRQKQ